MFHFFIYCLAMQTCVVLSFCINLEGKAFIFKISFANPLMYILNRYYSVQCSKINTAWLKIIHFFLPHHHPCRVQHYPFYKMDQRQHLFAECMRNWIASLVIHFPCSLKHWHNRDSGRYRASKGMMLGRHVASSASLRPFGALWQMFLRAHAHTHTHL